MPFRSTKTYGHSLGFSCCFRQWRAKNSHCRFLHGYAIKIKLTFDCTELDERNWVMDFGALKSFKQWAEHMFDHTLVIAEDDPARADFLDLQLKGLCQLRIVESVGCEKFAELCFKKMESLLADRDTNFKGRPINTTARLLSVEVSEHDANSAIYEREHDES